MVSGLAELVYHWNVKTPHWLGYIFQRPESHCIHHQEGVHAFNYSDLPMWDMLFGTYRNPLEWEDAVASGWTVNSVSPKCYAEWTFTRQAYQGSTRERQESTGTGIPEVGYRLSVAS